MDPYERKQAIIRMHEMLREQRERVTTKKEARKKLEELGIWHLLVPIKNAKPATAAKAKKTGKRKQVKARSTGK